jgi:hypothetical protein
VSIKLDVDLAPLDRRCVLYRTAALSHTSSGNFTAIGWDTERSDPEGWHAANASVITLPEDGLYMVSVNATFVANGTGYRSLEVRTNGGTWTWAAAFDGSSSGSYDHPMSVTTISHFAAGTDLEIYAAQSSGGTLAYGVGEENMRLIVAKL